MHVLSTVVLPLVSPLPTTWHAVAVPPLLFFHTGHHASPSLSAFLYFSKLATSLVFDTEQERFLTSHASPSARPFSQTILLAPHTYRCELHGCSRRPVYSYKGEKPRFCLAHKLDGMQDSRLNAEGRGRARAGPSTTTRHSQQAVSAEVVAQQRMYGQGSYGRTGALGGRGGVANGGGIMGGGHMGGGVDGDMMFAAGAGTKGPMSVSQTGGVSHRNVQARQAAAQATVSAAAAVIAAIEDEQRLDYGGHRPHSGHRSGGGGFRENEVDMYEVLQHGGGFGGGSGGGGNMSRPKTEIGAWANALFSADGRDGNGNGSTSLESSRPSSAGMAPPHGYGDVWQTAPSRTTSSPPIGSTPTLSDNGPGGVSVMGGGREMSESNMYHRMANVSSAPMDGGGGSGGASGRGVLTSQHYPDERNSRGFLSSLSNGGGGGSGTDFVSSFSNQQSNAWHGGEDDGNGGGGGCGGTDLQWERAERSRPRPPPLPSPLSQSSLSSPTSWGRPLAVNSTSEMHRHGGGIMHAPQQQQQRLPSILGSRRGIGGGQGGGGLGGVSGGMGGYAGGNIRDGGGYDVRSGREHV